MINSFGKFISLMIPVMTILMIVIIVARYFFGIGLTGLQELVLYIHALIFLGCAGYVHYRDEHVRVDIFYRESSDLYKRNINYITCFLFKLKNKPSALFQSLTGLSLRQVDMTKLQSFPEKGTFSSYYFICEVQGHINDEKVSGALKDLELHCSEFQLLGVFEQSDFRSR